MQNVIFAAYAEDEAQHNVNTNLYLQNVCCCLVSAKKHNPDDLVALITNAVVPVRYLSILEDAQIEIWQKSFDSYTLPEDCKWRLAFYKLCAVSYVVNELEFDKLLLLDTDVVTIGSYQELWQDADHALLLHQVVHSYDNTNETIMRRELKDILGLEHCIHWGGEFICGKTTVLKEVLCVARRIFAQMLETGKYTTRGDEFIWTAALKEFYVKSAVAYLARCWTGKGYYFATTYMYYPGLVALHLPDEKKRGMLRMFRLLERNQYPSNKRIFRMMRMPKSVYGFSEYLVLDLFERIKRRLVRK